MPHLMYTRLMAYALRRLIMLGLDILIGHYSHPGTSEIETGRGIKCTLPPSEEDTLRVRKDLQGE
jgi:hypothetical protein